MTSVLNICGIMCFHGCKRLRQEKGGRSRARASTPDLWVMATPSVFQCPSHVVMFVLATVKITKK